MLNDRYPSPLPQKPIQDVKEITRRNKRSRKKSKNKTVIIYR
jgi:hypothetical protein